MTDAYNSLVAKCDLIRTLFRFYPQAVEEMGTVWFNADWYERNTAHLASFPDEPSVEAAYAKLQQTVEPMLRFGIVHIAAAFEDFLTDTFESRLRRDFAQAPPKDISLSKEYKIQTDDLGGELNAFIIQERERFAAKGWKTRLLRIAEYIPALSKEPDLTNSDFAKLITFGSVSRFAALEETMALRNIILHNGGRASDRFQRQFPNSTFVKDGIVHITDNSVDLVRAAILEVAFYIDQHFDPNAMS